MIEERIPLLKDKHNHISIYSALIDSLDIQNIKSKNEALSKIKNRKDDISIILGWNTGYYKLEDKELNQLHPLIISDLSLHDIKLNKPAKNYLKEEFPELVENINNKLWVERNFSYIMKVLVSLKSLDVDKVNSFYDDLLENGILYAADMLLPNENSLEILRKSNISDYTEFWADFETYKDLSDSGKKKVNGIKFFTDGAIGTNTAAIKDQYKNGKEGLLLFRDKELREKLVERILENRPLSIHTIGDEASEKVLDYLEDIKEKDYDLPYIRMEHCQFVNKEYAEKAKKLGINFCMQPTFSFDSIYYEDRLPEYYIKNNNPFRMLIDEIDFEPGEDLFFGSDGMPHGIYYALESCLFPPLDSQKLTLEEFIDGYCVNNMKKGHVDVEIDYEENKLSTDVVLK
ncbi:MAG: amidohydrolase family protein [Thermoplasmatota archaeon]